MSDYLAAFLRKLGRGFVSAMTTEPFPTMYYMVRHPIRSFRRAFDNAREIFK